MTPINRLVPLLGTRGYGALPSPRTVSRFSAPSLMPAHRLLGLLVTSLATGCSVFVDTNEFTGDCAALSPAPLLCDDFESGLNTTNWTVAETNAMAVVDTLHAHSGAQSFHSQSPAVVAGPMDVRGQLVHAVTLPTSVYVRLWVYFDSPRVDGAELVASYEDHTPWNGVELQVISGQYAVNDWTPPGAFASQGDVILGSWQCLEWEVVEPTGGATSETAVWLGATELGGLHLTSLPVPADLGALRFGLSFNQVSAQPAYDLWIDDIVVDTQRIDCPS